MTGRFVLFLRSVGRALGVNKFIVSNFRSKQYEKSFDSALMNEINKGDIVWDVGANVGLYTAKFLKKVGSIGKVIAFEPTPGSVKRLNNIFVNKNVVIFDAALGENDGVVSMMFDSDPTSVTNKVISDVDDYKGVEVNVRSGDSIINSNPSILPNVVKIDVEGHELSVIKGMTQVLAIPTLRCIAMEIHFGILNDRGEGAAPNEINTTLKSFGYKVKWTDSSHLIATKII